jgi:hypothetical protein
MPLTAHHERFLVICVCPTSRHGLGAAPIAGRGSHKNCNLASYSLLQRLFQRAGGSVRHRVVTLWTTAVFTAATLVAQSALPAGSQPAESSEVWCKAHNPDPVAASRCIETERRLLSQSAKPKRLEKSTAPSADNPVSVGMQKPHARPLPLPRPRPQTAPTVTAEPVLQTFDESLQE